MMTTGTSATYYPESGMSSVHLPPPSSCLEQMASYHNRLTVPLQYSSLEDGGQNGLQILLHVSGTISDFIQKDCCP